MSKVNSILVSQPRSGTHFLTNILRNNKLNWSKDEPLYYFLQNHYNYYNNKATLDNGVAVLFQYYLNKSLPGFNLITGFSTHMYDINAINGLEHFKKHNSELKVLFLTRKNLLKRYVSRKIARITNQYNNQKTNVCVNLNFDEVVRNITKNITEQKMTKSLLNNNNIDFIDLYYEDLAVNTVSVLGHITNFLETPLQYICTTVKQESRPLKDIITNYNELKEQFSSTEYIEFFE
jgi:hypothetical protein